MKHILKVIGQALRGDFPIVKWIENKNKTYREGKIYMLVDDVSGKYLFTSAEAKKAQKRATKNPEDFE
jgi:hypothetical protein